MSKLEGRGRVSIWQNDPIEINTMDGKSSTKRLTTNSRSSSGMRLQPSQRVGQIASEIIAPEDSDAGLFCCCWKSNKSNSPGKMRRGIKSVNNKRLLQKLATYQKDYVMSTQRSVAEQDDEIDAEFDE